MKRIAWPLSILFGFTFAVTTQSTAQSPNYTLQLNANPDKCLHKKNPDWENGNPIHLWDCGVDKSNESWKKTIFAVNSSTTNINNPIPVQTAPVTPVAANDGSGSTCSGSNQLTSAEIQEILRVHNAARAEVNVPPLKWNCKLADFAQNWVNRDVWGHSSSEDRQKIILGSYSGENLAAAAPSSENIVVTNGPTGWWQEKAFWNSDSVSCQAGKVCGHYTQMVWRDTTEVGCGINRKSSAMGGEWAQNSVYLSCVYNPGGNISGRRPF